LNYTRAPIKVAVWQRRLDGAHDSGSGPLRQFANRMMFGLDVWALASLSVLAVGLIALAVIDFRTGYLPDWIQLVLAVAGLGVVLIGSPVKLTWPMALLGATINMAVFYGLRWIVSRIKNREAMGLGDVKLVGVGGLWLGPLALPYIMAVGGIATLLGALVAGVITGKPVWQGEMPLGPGLALGILGTYIAALAGVSLLPGAV